MTKYWLLTTEFPPFSGGGISTYCNHTSKMFAKAGYQVTVFVPNRQVKNYQISYSDRVRLINFNPSKTNNSPDFGYYATLSYAFAYFVSQIVQKEGAPDIIESQDYMGIAYYLQQFKLTGVLDLKNTPIVITLHSPAFLYLAANRVPVYKFPNFWTSEMEKNSIYSADYLISPTLFLKEKIECLLHIPPKKAVVIPNPYKTIPITDIPAYKKNKLVFYGKLSRQKGTFHLFKNMKEMWDEGFPHPIIIVGGSDIVYHPEQQTMKKIIIKNYNDYYKKGLIQFVGKIEESQLVATLSDAHVIIFPSIIDNLPYTIIESMALGKVVLASLEGGQREIIEHGKTGFTFTTENSDDFKIKISIILSLSDKEINDIGAEASATIQKKYNPETIYPRKHQLFQEIISTKSAQANIFPFLHQERIKSDIQTTNSNLLSVIIPYYNMGDYLLEAVSSIKKSSYQDIEIIIVNDGSTDIKSITLLETIKKDGQIKIINQKNLGLAKARNTGAQNANGGFIAFLDADDRVHEKYYHSAISLLQNYDNVFFVGCWVEYFGKSSKKWLTTTPQPPYILVHNSVNSSGLVYKKEAFLKAGLNDINVDYGLEDYESVVNMMSNGYNGIVIPEILFFYRVRSNSMYRKINTTKFLYSYKYISDKHNSYFQKYATDIINIINANGPGFLYDNPTFETSLRLSIKANSKLSTFLKDILSRNNFIKDTLLTIKHKLKI